MRDFRLAVGLVLFIGSIVAQIMSVAWVGHHFGPKMALLFLPIITALLGLLMVEDV